MKKRCVASMLIVVMLVLSVLGNFPARVYAQDNAVAFAYAILTLSEDDDSLTVSAMGGCVNGDLASHGAIDKANVQVYGKTLEHVTGVSSVNLGLLEADFFNSDNGKMFLDYPESAVFTDGLNLNSPIRVEDSLTVYGSSFNANNTCIYAKNGDVTIDCDNISISGLIYVPHGTLTLTGDYVNLNNVCIVADKVHIECTYYFNVNVDHKYAKYVEESGSGDSLEQDESDNSQEQSEGETTHSGETVDDHGDSSEGFSGDTEVSDTTESSEGTEVTDTTETSEPSEIDDNSEIGDTSETGDASEAGDTSETSDTSETDDSTEKVIELIDSLGLSPFVYASARKKYDSLEIYWYTNIKSESCKILKSSNNIDYEEVATVSDTNKYVYRFYDDCSDNFFIVSIGDIKSYPFKVLHRFESIEVIESDSDGDEISDSIELIFGTDPYNSDSDSDGVSDHDEVMIIGADPLNPDTDKDGIDDYHEDSDSDGILDGEEVLLGTFPRNEDTDFDEILDKDEIEIYHTDPCKADTDSDGADDLYEIEHGTNPIVADESFVIEKYAGSIRHGIPVTAGVKMEIRNGSVDSLDIERVTSANNPFIVPMIAGYMGDAYDFTIDAEFDTAELTFMYDTSIWTLSDEFMPRIYYFNEKTKSFEELPDQVVEEGKVTAVTTHFSTYILLNKVEFSKVWKTDIRPESDDEPLDIMFVLDISGSMGKLDKLQTAKETLNRFIDSMRPGDRLSLVTFADSATLEIPFTSDKELMREKIETLNPGWHTLIYTGIDKANEECMRVESDNRIMILISDGIDTVKKGVNYDTVIARATHLNKAIYTIGVGGDIDKQILEKLAKYGNGVYYYAENPFRVEDLVGTVRTFYSKTKNIDIWTDSNDDGISDYFTEKIKDGEVVVSNGSTEFTSFDFNYNLVHNLSNDWDGDGIPNGEEIKIVNLNSESTMPVILMKSNPLMKHSDADGIDDYTEVKNNSDPLSVEYDKSSVDYLCNSSLFAYTSIANDMKVDFRKSAIAYSARITGAADKVELYTEVLINYYSEYDDEDSINDAQVIEYKKTASEMLFGLISGETIPEEVQALGELVNWRSDFYSLKKDVFETVSVINGAKTIDEVESLGNDFFSKEIMYMNKLCVDGNKLNYDAVRLTPGSGIHDEYIVRYMTKETALEYVKVLDDASKGIQIASYISDMAGIIYSISKINANNAVFKENIDFLDRLSQYDRADGDLRRAAKNVKNQIGRKYSNIYFDLISRKVGLIGVDASIQFIVADWNPYTRAIVAVRDALLVAIGGKEDVEQIYRQVCYAEMADVYGGMLRDKLIEHNYDRRLLVNRVVNPNDANPNDVRRYMVNLAYIRILGEKEYCYYYRNEGILSGIINYFSDYSDVRNYTVETIQRIAKEAEKLKISISDKMMKVG